MTNLYNHQHHQPHWCSNDQNPKRSHIPRLYPLISRTQTGSFVSSCGVSPIYICTHGSKLSNLCNNMFKFKTDSKKITNSFKGMYIILLMSRMVKLKQVEFNIKCIATGQTTMTTNLPSNRARSKNLYSKNCAG
jgi:hypothetical protein